MAGGRERILRRRIKSIQSTQKITRAQELIAASRIAKAQAQVTAAQPYSDAITQVVGDLAAGGGPSGSALLAQAEEIRKVAYIVVVGDRGLCGAYNSTVIRTAERAIAEQQRLGRDYALVLSGRKAEGYFRYRDYSIDAAFSGFSQQPAFDDARAIGAAATALFVDGDADVVELIYTKFLSAGVQSVVQERLMPLNREEISSEPTPGYEPPVRAGYEFEPEVEQILDLLLPRYVDSRVFAALLNAAASEHAARQRAMKSATDNAEDLITSLSRSMNRARQDAITTEIMEIVSGAEALRSGGDGIHSEDLLSDTIEGREEDLFAARHADN